MCLCAVQPLTKLSTHQRLQFFLLFSCSRFPSHLYMSPPVSSQNGRREANYIIIPHSGGQRLRGAMLQTSCEARVKINPLLALSSCLLVSSGSVPPHPVLPTQHSAKPCDMRKCFTQVEYLLLLFLYRLYRRFGEFYFVPAEY